MLAKSYGNPNGLSEMRLGRLLPAMRDRVLIVSKIGNWGARTGQSVPKTTPDMIRSVRPRLLRAGCKRTGST